MEIKVYDTPDALAPACADEFVSLLTSKKDCVLGLATGASPIPTYKELIKRYNAGIISFKHVSTFNLDEYVGLPRDDKNSYYTFMHENLFDSIDIDKANTHILNGNADDTQKECSDFDAAIAAAGGIDIQLLGIGTNGHIGFNEPNDVFSDGTYKVKLTESTVKSNSIYFTENAMPEYALTMGINSIMAAKKIILIATGASKAEAIKKAVKGDVTPHCPASILQNHPNCIFFLDKTAASLL